MIYLDNNATTRVDERVLAAMEPYSTRWYGNPHSSHRVGRAAREGLESARASVASLLGAGQGQLVFTSCGTESNAIVIRGLQRNHRRRIVATGVEHPSILKLLERLRSRGDIELVTVSPDPDGHLRPEAFASVVDTNTALVCVMLAQNETGVIHPVTEIAAIAHAAGARVLVDAVQAAGKIPIDVDALDADFVSVSGHKLHAPKGVGALWIRAGHSLDPLWLGGGQEFGLRSGTEPVGLAVGFGEACRLAASHMAAAHDIADLRDLFERTLLHSTDAIRINGAASPRLPNTSSVGVPGWIAPTIVDLLDREYEICASAGAACHSEQIEPSAVLRAMSIPRELALGTVRFSLSRFTTREEILAAAQAVVALATEAQPAAARRQEVNA